MSRSASGNSTSFNLLPPEIQCEILKQIPDRRTLRALLHASPRYFEVYRRSKAAILSHVAWNHITPPAVPIAVDALEQRKHTGPPRDRTAVLAFLQTFRQGSPPEAHGFSLDTSKALLQYHDIVEYFIEDFAVNRLTLIQGYFHPGKSHSAPHEPISGVANGKRGFNLSPTEYSRLARALYHVELYGQLFRTTWDSRKNDITLAEQSTLFLERLRDWELEEFLCVRNYLIERLTDYLNQVEDDFFQDFLENQPHVIESTGPDSRWNNDDMFFSDDWHGQCQEEWLEGCLTRDLRTLKSMLTADTSDDRFAALGSTDSPRNILSKALGLMPVYQYRPRSAWLGTSYDGVEFRDDVEKPNKAWLWAMIGQGHPRCSKIYADDEGLEGLRRWGYVLWDHQRLQSLGVLTKRAFKLPIRQERCFRRRSRTPSVEQRTRRQEEIWQREGSISTRTNSLIREVVSSYI